MATSAKSIIIHIAGNPASGKTTLCDKLKNIYGRSAVVVDTDDIEEANIRQLMRDKDFIDALHTHSPKRETMINAANHASIKDIIDGAKGKPVIIGGIAFDKRANPMHYADYLFFIELDMEELYRRRMLRTIDQFDNNIAKLRTIFRANRAPEEMYELMIAKLGMHTANLVPFARFKFYETRFKRSFREQGYVFLSSAQIIAEIDKIIGE